MSSRTRRPKRAKRLPAIVPRFLKGIATIGAIPTLAGACEKGSPRMQPVVAQYSAPVVAAYALDAEPPLPAPVVAAYVPQGSPEPVAAADAGVDAPRAAPKKSPRVDAGPQAIAPPAPPPPVVAAYAPPVVAAYVPRNQPPPKPKTKK
ncbi:MAG TPA: hypothetical protein VLB44_10715 [Kofleriaceae bacterium]|nr:hypothetical protein [Kofleriaceae bacterium]